MAMVNVAAYRRINWLRLISLVQRPAPTCLAGWLCTEMVYLPVYSTNRARRRVTSLIRQSTQRVTAAPPSAT